MPTLKVTPASIPPGGTAVVEVQGLGIASTLNGVTDLVRRSDNAVVATANIVVQFPAETVGLQATAGTTYFVRITTPGFTLTQSNATTFAAKHNG